MNVQHAIDTDASMYSYTTMFMSKSGILQTLWVALLTDTILESC